MIVSNDLSRMSPSEKAALIYSQAQSDVTARLWRAALGSEAESESEAQSAQRCETFNLDSLLSLLAPQSGKASPATPASPETETLTPAVDAPAPVVLQGAVKAASGPLEGLGPNAGFRDVIHAAAERTGLPAAALAAIVDAEAGKNCDGKWNTSSRNPRSSAAGLGQFLAGTWQSEAERAGTWLNGVAGRQGWLGENGRVLPGARSALLALRYDGAASINATADYALRSVKQLKNAGVAVGDDVSTVARAAYLGHHLGTGDAIRFLKGGLDSGRARLLLDAQVGTASANRKIAATGDAASAHRSWLLSYVDRHVTPGRFAS
jgi:hypothetical protein